MMFYDFSTSTHGKWILAGEHAVLRGNGALVFPIKQKKLTLNYTPSASKLSAEYSDSSVDVLKLLFWSVLERGQQLLGQSLNHLTGHFHLECNIPIGVGMGASAALCVAMSRWFEAQHLLQEFSVPLFALNLENLFHGKSSGLDIAGVSTDAGIYFQQGNIEHIQQNWHPSWYLSSCNQIGITSHCIQQVEQLWSENSTQALQIDSAMAAAVKKARTALEFANTDSLTLLTEAIQQSSDCFSRWGLVSENLLYHLNLLLDHGALAAKPTGSGGGGYVLSLWKAPPNNSPVELIAI